MIDSVAAVKIFLAKQHGCCWCLRKCDGDLAEYNPKL